jgi:hypothetical protein
MKRFNRVWFFLSIIFRIFTISVYLFHFIFMWMFESGDSFYYLTFAKYLTTGIYHFQYPFIYQRPTTLAAPFYSFILVAIGNFPRADIWLHAIQLLMLIGTTLLLHQILRKFISDSFSIIISCLFALFPTNLIFASYILTEIPAIFGFTLFIYLSLKYLNNHQTNLLSLLVLLAAMLTLLRYQFAILFVGATIILAINIIRNHKITIFNAVFFSAGLIMIIGWLIYNHAITRVWGLSDTTKIRFHASFVNYGHHYPPENDPAVIEYNKFVPPIRDKYSAWWDVQDDILPKVNHDWRKVDEIVGNVGLAAVKYDPMGYLVNTGQIFLAMHTIAKTPWWPNLFFFGQDSDYARQQVVCDAFDNFHICKPIVMTERSFQLFSKFIGVIGGWYMRGFPVFSLFILFPMIVINLIFGHLSDRFLATIYLIPLIFASSAITPEPRYLIPFYPLMIILVVRGFQVIGNIMQSIFRIFPNIYKKITP